MTIHLRVGLASLILGWAAQSSAQVIVNETFDYPDTATLQTKWNSPTGLTLDGTTGLGSPSANHSGAASAHAWTGSSFSLTPTDANPVVLSADLWYTGASGQRNTVGLRNGASPLFEMGFYNDSSLGAAGLATRVLNFDGNPNWHGLVNYADLGTTPEWIRLQATFTGTSATISYDLGANGTIDGSYTTTGTAPANPFVDLRFGGPSALSSAGGGFNVDNIRLEVVPEPGTLTLGLLGLLGLVSLRSRKS